MGRTQEQVTRSLARIGRPREQAEPKADKPKAVRPDRVSCDRWQTLNEFVDVIAPLLTLAERAVWLVMYRHARGGTCDTSERSIATLAKIDKATAGRALRQLVHLRLVWPVFKSSSKGSASKYGVHPRPSACLAAAIAVDERRRNEAHQRRQRNGGDRRGRRRVVQEPGERFTRMSRRTG